MGLGPGCTRCEVPWLYPYLRRVEDEEEYALSSRGVGPPTTVRLPWAVSRRVSVIRRLINWSDEEGKAGVVVVVSTHRVVLSQGQYEGEEVYVTMSFSRRVRTL